jgi:hypothetical protein
MKLKTTFEGLENIGWVTNQEACGYIHTSHMFKKAKFSWFLKQSAP